MGKNHIKMFIERDYQRNENEEGTRHPTLAKWSLSKSTETVSAGRNEAKKGTFTLLLVGLLLHSASFRKWFGHLSKKKKKQTQE